MKPKAINEVDLDALQEGLDELEKLADRSLGVGVSLTIGSNDDNELAIVDIEPLGIIYSSKPSEENLTDEEKNQDKLKELIDKIVLNFPVNIYLDVLYEINEASKKEEEVVNFLKVKTIPGVVVGLISYEDISKLMFLITKESIIEKLIKE